MGRAVTFQRLQGKTGAWKEISQECSVQGSSQLMSCCVHCFVVFCSGLLLYYGVVGDVGLLFHHCLLCCGGYCGIVVVVVLWLSLWYCCQFIVLLWYCCVVVIL